MDDDKDGRWVSVSSGTGSPGVVPYRKTVVVVVVVVMAALWNRADHYTFALWFLSSIYLSFFIPRLISAAANWMSTILPHMVWP